MRAIRSVVLGLILVPAGIATLAAQPGQAGQTPPAAPQGQPPPAPQTPPKDPQADPSYKETVVVSASKTEQQLVDAPATMSVIGPRALSVAPTGNYADLLRNVPGTNITQISARDVNITSRGATSSLGTSQLAVLDGRSIYQDFFGFVMWDFMPANLDEIKRIEVIRGPASAVWGANALNGVINVLTKTPREMAGTSFAVGAGSFNREVDENGADNGSLFYVRGTHAQAVNDRWAYRVSAGTYDSDALARPIGAVPNGSGVQYQPYTNTGTTQPKFDVRFDYDFPDGGRTLQFSGGAGGTDGVMHTGIGPFDIARGAVMSYAKMNYTQKAFRLQAFMNTLDGKAVNLVSVDTNGQPVGLNFDTTTLDVEASDTRIVKAKHVLTYGGNLRLNLFELTIAPGETSRTEGGAYIQDEFLMTDRYRLVAGGRVDKFSSIDQAVFSPRVAFIVKPQPNQSIRASYNRAFRAPSMVNNNLETTVATALPLGAIHPAFGSAIFYVPTAAVGNKDLTEEHIDAYELAYTGDVRNRALLSVAVYYNNFADQISFTSTEAWLTPPPGFPGLGPVPPAALWQQLINNGIIFPKSYTYLNLGTVKSKGIELGVDGMITPELSGFANYAFQADPIAEFPGLTEEQAQAEINRPAKHLFNLGVTYISPRWFGTFTVSRSSRAFWQDVLDARYHGYTEPYTTVSTTLGVKFQGGRYAASLKATNLGNAQVQQHFYGDIVKRQVIGEFKVNLPR